MTNTHLNRYKPGDKKEITRGKKFRNVNAPNFPKPKIGLSHPRYDVIG